MDILKAIQYLLQNSKQKFTLSIIGSGPIEQEIKQMIKDFDIEQEVTFLERTPYEKLRFVYSAHDILVLPSYNEAIGMVVPEAMACGVPVVVSDTCGSKTYVVDGKNGYIFKTHDYMDLVNKILLLKDFRKRKFFGEHAMKHIRKNFDVKVIGKKFNKIVKDALK